MPNVLVVDDSAVDRRLAGGLLEANSNFSIGFAEHGAAALASIRANRPDIVVTDLQMPELDGLELVRIIRHKYTDLPVILMTAHGSEALAVEALQEGAAGYVPKAQLADNLLNTVEQVLSLARAERSYERLIDSLQRTEFTFQLTNDAALVEPLVDLVQQILAGMKVCDATERVRVGVALSQALTNSLYHGNLEISAEEIQEDRENLLLGKGFSLVERRRGEAPYRDRRIQVEIHILPEEARIMVRDEGKGFDTSTFPMHGDASAVQRENGRGLVLMRAFMDDVTYNQAGNEVTMVKRRTSLPPETIAQDPAGASQI